MPDTYTTAQYQADVRAALRRRCHLDVEAATHTPDTITVDLGVFDDHGRLTLRWARAAGWAWDLAAPIGDADTDVLCPTSAMPSSDEVAWALEETRPHLYQLAAISRAMKRLATALPRWARRPTGRR